MVASSQPEIKHEIKSLVEMGFFCSGTAEMKFCISRFKILDPTITPTVGFYCEDSRFLFDSKCGRFIINLYFCIPLGR